VRSACVNYWNRRRETDDFLVCFLAPFPWGLLITSIHIPVGPSVKWLLQTLPRSTCTWGWPPPRLVFHCLGFRATHFRDNFFRPNSEDPLSIGFRKCSIIIGTWGNPEHKQRITSVLDLFESSVYSGGRRGQSHNPSL
jgi:hypothetical protein